MRLALKGWIIRLSVVIMTTALTMASQAFAEEASRGVVAETMSSGGYTYILLDRQGHKEWFAVPESQVKVGDEVQIRPGAQMGAYTSTTLGRTFDRIVFSPGISVVLNQGAATAVGQEEKKVTRAEGPEAYTIAEIYEKKEALNGKKAVVRGKVVKVVPHEGRQWLRLIDGTGSSKRGNHKLVVTTAQSVAVDDIVTARGTVAADKLFGALTYEVIVEDATLEKVSK